MSYAPEYAERDMFAIDATLDDRVAFLRKTYAHLFGAVVLFIALCAAILNSDIAEPLSQWMMASRWMVLFAFMAAGGVARAMVHRGASEGVQYIGLAIFIAVYAIFFTPLLFWVSESPGGPETIQHAGIVTLFIFAGLTAIVMLTRTDFSFLRNILMVAMLAAFVLVIGSVFMGFNLGIWFVGGMIVLMCGYILYDTSNVLHHLRTDQHVSAALELFASLALLFFYVLQLMSYLRR